VLTLEFLNLHRFITFDAVDRYDMISVMMQLRMMTYPSNDEPVMVRLRASVLPSRSSTIRVDSFDHNHVSSVVSHTADPTEVVKKKRRKKKRSKRNKNSASASSNAATIASTVSDLTNAVDSTKSEGPSPIGFSNDDFPLLHSHNDDDNVEWGNTSVDIINDSINDDIEDDETEESSTNKDEHIEDDDGEAQDVKRLPKLGLQHCDTASTATATSSNASSGSDNAKSSQHISLSDNGVSPANLYGYAAALRRVPPSPLPVPTGTSNISVCTAVKTGENIELNLQSASATNEESMCSAAASLSVSSQSDLNTNLMSFVKSSSHKASDTDTSIPNSWGNRRSFVEVIRENVKQ
jgi:hypothetical protein